VVEVEPGRQLVLQAEMRVPGKAWLTWRIESGEAPDKVRLHQAAYFAPKGLFGRFYWYAMLPFHWLIFRRMAHAIANEAASPGEGVVERRTQRGPLRRLHRRPPPAVQSWLCERLADTPLKS
jgi:hypothetical protein